MSDLTLKDEFNERKVLQEVTELLNEYENFDSFFILNEAIDSEKLKEIAANIEKLDAIVSKINSPTLKSSVSLAVKDIESFISNDMSDPKKMLAVISGGKMFNPVTKAMSLFSALTKFFADVPVIMKTFRAGKDPALPLNQDQTINQKSLQDTFTKALKPAGILGFFGLKTLPYLGSPEKVAQELMALTPQQLNPVAAQAVQVKIPFSAQDKVDFAGMSKGVAPKTLVQGTPQAQQGVQAASGQPSASGGQTPTPEAPASGGSNQPAPAGSGTPSENPNPNGSASTADVAGAKTNIFKQLAGLPPNDIKKILTSLAKALRTAKTPEEFSAAITQLANQP